MDYGGPSAKKTVEVSQMLIMSTRLVVAIRF